MENNHTELAVIVSESGRLLQMAIEKDLDVDKLRALMDLRDREDRRKSEREFEEHFAEMQKDYIPAFKTKTVHTKSGAEAYNYCPLPQILAVYAPILARHGFSYRWEEMEVQGKNEKMTTCFLSGYGFTRQASISLPYGDQNLLINSIQARGATSEYGRRYTFMNVTGCIVADELDTDGKIEPQKPAAPSGQNHFSQTSTANQNHPAQPVQPVKPVASNASTPTGPVKFIINDSVRSQMVDMMTEMEWPAKRQSLVFQKAELVSGEKVALEGITKEYTKFLDIKRAANLGPNSKETAL